MSRRCRRVLRSRRRLPAVSCDGISTHRDGSALASVSGRAYGRESLQITDSMPG